MCCFFDVTTLYFESFEKDELREYGFSKDCKFNQTQVVLALVTNYEGHPLSYELFPGSMSEGKTLVSVVERLRKDFCVNRAVLVADRAMFSEKNRQFMEENGIQYVVAAKLKSLKKEIKQEILDTKINWLKKEKTIEKNELRKIKEIKLLREDKKKLNPSKEKLPERRLIFDYSPQRASKDFKDRKTTYRSSYEKSKKWTNPYIKPHL